MTLPRDWFVSDEQIQELFRVLRGQSRVAAVELVASAAAEAERQLPTLGTAARAQLATALQLIRDQLSAAIDQAGAAISQQVAHAIRVLAAAQPQLRAQVNDLAREAGAAASEGAIDNVNRQTETNLPWVVATAVAAAAAVALAAVLLAQRANAADAARREAATVPNPADRRRPNRGRPAGAQRHAHP